MFYLTTHSTHFIYGYMASDIWLRTILIVRKETRCRHIGYSYQLPARVLLYAPSHRQDDTYHILCYTSRGALASSVMQWLSHQPLKLVVGSGFMSWLPPKMGARCSSVVRWVVGSILHGEPIEPFELFLVPASVP